MILVYRVQLGFQWQSRANIRTRIFEKKQFESVKVVKVMGKGLAEDKAAGRIDEIVAIEWELNFALR